MRDLPAKPIKEQMTGTKKFGPDSINKFEVRRSGLKIPEFGHNSEFLAALFFHFSKICGKVLSRYFGHFCGKKGSTVFNTIEYDGIQYRQNFLFHKKCYILFSKQSNLDTFRSKMFPQFFEKWKTIPPKIQNYDRISEFWDRNFKYIVISFTKSQCQKLFGCVTC